jgi:hypothetical protein
VTAPSAGQALVILAAGQAKRYGGLKPLAPVGPQGEGIVDLVASDAITAGFDTLVIVVGPTTGPEIQSHIRSSWPSDLDVCFALQKTPRGTVDAVRSAWAEIGGRGSFGVANADDLYGPAALDILFNHLSCGAADSALVGFRLDRAVIGTSPVTRGVCATNTDGYLTGIDERRGVARREDGKFETGDGRSPEVLDPDTRVSMNLWGFSADLEVSFEEAMDNAGEGEVLLPELVANLVARGADGARFKVLPTESRCVGVTHPGDLELVQDDVRGQIERGERPAALWGSH